MSDLAERLRMVSNMIHLGERISWGQETTLMDEAAAEIDRLRAALEEIADYDTGATAGLAYTAKLALEQTPIKT